MSAAGPHVSRSRAGSSTATHEKGRLAHMHGYAMATPNNTINASRYFDPCAATASMFLYAQGTSVVCCHYDTLAIERRFARHAEEVQLLAVDNHSDIGAGRLVVSYDVGQTAIVWDLLTGDEVARFASYENLTCASWMRNGNVAFGNSQGNVILFEPTTSEHLSARTIDQIAITAISPAADCRTFAIGYQNGSLLIATLQPRFTILHNLTTSSVPSPIVTLSWHASSSRSKSDMLSVQTNDGDLRVWSVSKAYNADDPAKIVRILKRTENYLTGPNWMGVVQERPDYSTLRIVSASGSCQPGHVSESESQVEITFRPADMSDQEDGRSPLARYLQSESDTEQYRPTTPASNISRSTVSISSSTSQTAARRYPASTVSRGMTENTYISAGSSLRSGYTQPRERKERESLSTTSSISMGSSHYHTARKPSRLRNEVPRSPEDARVVDLFKFTKSRLADVPYKAPFSSDNSRLTNDDLRRQMLSTIFGWHKDIDDLVRDEMSRHPLGSTNRILLAKWLGDINTDIMAMGSENMTSSDWMLLALSGIGGQASQHKLGRAYVQRLLESGDVHAAATIMVGMGDHNDAVEIYVSHKKYMEALVLTCLFFPAAWERQEQIVKKWGEWAVQHGQQQLAIRCFACTGRESTEPWSSPSAQQLTFPSITQTVPELLSPPLSPPVMNHGPQRSIAKNSALKLITSFDPHAKNRLLANVDDGKTPIAAAATPMLETALSPGGADPATAILRGNRSQFNTPASARPVHGFGRQRLPSIGEAPDSAQRDLLTAIARPEGDPYANAFQSTEVHDTAVRKLELTRPNTASPRLMKENVKGHPPPSPSPAAVAALMEGGRYRRNGSRSRIPEGLDLSLPSFKDSLPEDLTSPEPSANSSVRYHWPSRRRGPGSVASSVSVASAASSVARSQRGYHNSQSKGLDNYVHSLDAAPTKKQIRESSRDGRNERATSRSRKDNRGKSQDRGRASSRSYTPKGGKRSPKSPVPMSPEDLINLATPKEDFDQMSHNGGKGRLIDISNDEMELPSQPSTVKKVGYANRDGSRVRGSSRTASRNGRSSSRARSPDKRHVPPALDLRGRSVSRGPPSNRSPSSPQPMSANLQQHYYGEKSDLRRNTSHAGTETSSRRKIAAPLKTPAPMQLVADNNSGDLRVIKDERQLKKEAAARELEARRKSLATRPSAPPIMHPDEITPAPLASALPSLMELPSTTYVPPKKEDLPFRSASVDPSAGRSMYATRNRPAIGLPATPRAMRLVMDSESSSRNAPVPPIPSTFAQASPAMPPQPQPQPQPQRESPGRRSPERVEEERKVDDIPMLLSSSVYTPPPPAQSRIAAQIGRSMSAPPRDLVQPETQSRRPSVVNSTSMGRRPSHDANAFPARRPSHDANAFPTRRPSHDANANIPPPPPPPVPPMLKELQHLAQPPPPPPAPLPHVGGPQPVVYGGSSGMIEIVMDDDQPQPPQQLQQQLQQQLYPQQYQPQQQQHQQPPPPPPIPSAIPVSEATVPIISTPNPRNGHNRGRSSVDSIAGRISRATERMRSASRSRGPSSIKSPEMMGGAPYESVPPPPPPAPSSHPPVSMGMNYRVQNQVVYQQVQAQVAQQEGRNEYRTGLHQSEMI
ncbi:hypothetical protein CHGG_07866 [Chaetomium globosum CBS 148.51]|uniref:Gem-associated protein 5 TPR domain-containing protein n=1 Tax=Chaetomium globosum (strain ATCC 6205 / CBS 148.51 / DSM 1962 / NBRC 6347 / NRRL 1970) TaxID=306901 RepID=Q2GVY8_CHAGB|nr:uncharacterized protein CHGG_07866 [Chaetomium globosum CBS 148.51]EAQ86613.1 hypothetical protein CHGG_07866 [Chaetomium globosum CBS 148.51]